MPQQNTPPVKLGKYLKYSPHKYISYEDGARELGIPYWRFVKLAKEAKATMMLRHTAICDMAILYSYLAKTIENKGDYENGQKKKRR